MHNPFFRYHLQSLTMLASLVGLIWREQLLGVGTLVDQSLSRLIEFETTTGTAQTSRKQA